MIGIAGVDPHAVPVGVNAECATAVGFAAVLGDAEHRRHPVDAIGVAGIDANLRVVERPCVAESATARTRRLVSVRHRPGRAAVGGAIDAAVVFLMLARIGLFAAGKRVGKRVCLHPGVDGLRIGWGHGDADASLHRPGEPSTLYLAPGCSGIGRLPESAPRPAALQEIRPPHAFPARRVERVVIPGIHGEIDEARLVAHEFHQLPRRATIGRFVESALGVRIPRVSQCRDIHDVWVRWIDDDAPDLLRRFEARELPRAAAVGRFVDTAAGRDGVSRILLPCSRVDDVGIRRGEGDVSH